MRGSLEGLITQYASNMRVDKKEFMNMYDIALRKQLKRANIPYEEKVYWDNEELTNKALTVTIRYYRRKLIW